jgi:hypothetical protein
MPVMRARAAEEGGERGWHIAPRAVHTLSSLRRAQVAGYELMREPADSGTGV